ncbi:MAG: ECF transporter S component [Clostridia bacterium]|nr:ECF transporter S component [Clostridia bacterium]
MGINTEQQTTTVEIKNQIPTTITSKKTFIQDFTQLFTAKNMARIGILSALSYVLYMFVKFSLPFMFPSWLDIQFSDIPALLGSFAINPYAGAIIVIVKCLLKMPFTSSACVGELVDILIGLSLVVPAGFIYRRLRTKKGAIIGMVVGTIASTIVAMLSNRLFIIPFYVQVMFNGNWAPLLNMVRALYPNITVTTFYNYYIWLACLPFNLLRLIVVSVITTFTYKPLRVVL